jgi:hypothetical protein
MLLPIFGSPHKIKLKKLSEKKIIYIGSSEKKTQGRPKNDKRLVEEVQKYKD